MNVVPVVKFCIVSTSARNNNSIAVKMLLKQYVSLRPPRKIFNSYTIIGSKQTVGGRVFCNNESNFSLCYCWKWNSRLQQKSDEGGSSSSSNSSSGGGGSTKQDNGNANLNWNRYTSVFRSAIGWNGCKWNWNWNQAHYHHNLMLKTDYRCIFGAKWCEPVLLSIKPFQTNQNVYPEMLYPSARPSARLPVRLSFTLPHSIPRSLSLPEIMCVSVYILCK